MRVPGWAARGVDAALEVSVAGSFSRVGYEVRRRLTEWQQPDGLAGRVVIVTGATSGIGRAATEMFAGAGATVIAVGRSPERLEQLSAHPGVETYRADLSDLDRARRFVEDFAATHDRLDVLVHNAGALVADHRTTPQGFEETYAAQVLAPHLITAGLLPLLSSCHGRVIVVSSGGMYTQRLDLSTLDADAEEFDGVQAYARAKRAQVTMTEEWARRAADSGVTFQSMHPGWADTPGVRTSLPTFHRLTGPFLRTPEQGADTIVWLATAPEGLTRNGSFWLDRRPRGTQRLPGTAADEQTAAALWDRICRDTAAVPS